MAPLTQRGARFAGPLRIAARLGGFVLLAVALYGFSDIHAQVPERDPQPKLEYSRALTFFIPFTVEDSRVVKVHLSVSEDRGKSYKKVTGAVPTDKNFRFTAGGDGLYWFATQVELRDGKLYPDTAGPTP